MTDKEYAAEFEDENLMEHEYDGIRELDNRLPPWWLNLFYVSIVWAVGYILYFHVLGIGDLSIAQYNKEINPNWAPPKGSEYRPLQLVKAYHPPYYNPGREITPLLLAESSGEPLFAAVVEEEDEDTVYELLTDAESLAKGEKTFMQNCISCHGKLGEGGVGPNLTDDYWIHGDGQISDIIRTIRNGVPIKGMISWKNYLPQQKILEVGSYVYSLRGTNPPNAKAPQGEKIEIQ